MGVAFRQLGVANDSSAKSIEKLSSGYRINRAGDDAAGLAISEKMRGQIRGLNQASSNAQDGISLIQTAEGALNETHAILQRMRELTVQAASDTNVEADRGEIQKELTQLTEEIDRIATTTEFNTMKLVNGDRSNKHVVKAGVTTEGTPVEVTKAVDQTVKVGVNAAAWSDSDSDSASKFDIKIGGTAGNGFDWADIKTTDAELVITRTGDDFALTFANGEDTAGKKLDIDAELLSFDAETDTYSYNNHGIDISFTSAEVADWATTETVTIDLATIAGAGTDVTGTHSSLAGNLDLEVTGTATVPATYEMSDVTITAEGALAGVDSVEIEWDEGAGTFTAIMKNDTTTVSTTEFSLASGEELKYNENGISFTFTGTTGNDQTDAKIGGTINVKTEKATVTPTTTTAAETEDKSLKFQVGANQDQFINLSIEDMGSKALNIDAIKVDSHDSAKAAITTVNEAIERVSGERSKLGAVQNRLEHTIKNLDTSSENLQASEARIRDVDMAKEMMEQTKQNILSQASTAMLAQANQAPQAVLQLLR